MAPKTAAQRTAAAAPAAAKHSRRAPDPAARLRDAERSRQRIFDAALVEFSEKGFAGARVRAIAERAGVNSQLISYYFGGKEGLYQEIMRRWHEQEAGIEQQVEENGSSFADLVTAYFSVMTARPELLRIFVWDGLNQTSPVPPPTYGPGADPPEVADIRRRQAAGEIAGDLDPAYLLITLMGAALTPVTMPQQIEHLCGLPADSEEFLQKFAAQVRLILEHLRGTPPPP